MSDIAKLLLTMVSHNELEGLFMVRIFRESINTINFINKLSIYKIYIDHVYFGSIGNGEIKEFDIGEGHHTIYLKIDWCRSNVLNFNVIKNEIIELQCGNSNKSSNYIDVLLYLTIFKNKYLFIKFKGNY